MAHHHQTTSACHCSSLPLQINTEATKGYPPSRTRDLSSENLSIGHPLLPLLLHSTTRNRTLRPRKYRASGKRSNPSRRLLRRPNTSFQKPTKHARPQNNVLKRFETIFRNSASVKRDHPHQICLLLPPRPQKLKIARAHPSGVSNSGMEPIQPRRVLPSLP